MSETPRTAIDTALIKGNLGCQYLEITRPTKQDLKIAAEGFKEASDILKASLVLLDHDCYTVQEAPASAAPAPPLFAPTGEPTPAADQTPTPAAPTSELPTLGYTDVEIIPTRKFKVGDKVKATENALEEPGTVGEVMSDDGAEEDNAPYQVRFFPNSHLTFCDAHDLDLITEEEWTAGTTGVSEPFPKGKKADRKKVFDQRLDSLEEIFCECLDLAGSLEPMGKQLAQFRPHRDAWKAAWKTDPKKAWTEILKAIAEANKVGTEFTSWAPAA